MIGSTFARRKRLLLAVIVVLVIAAAIAWRVFRVGDLLDIGTRYAAQQTCACTFISGRTLDSCLTDLEPLAQRLIRVRVGEDVVEASGLLHLFSARARFERGFGCKLED